MAYKSEDFDMETDPKTIKELQLHKSDMDLLKDLLQQRLDDCGWRESIREMIYKILDERGVHNVSYDELAAEILPKAQAMVPEALRQELQQRVLKSLDTEIYPVKDEY